MLAHEYMFLFCVTEAKIGMFFAAESLEVLKDQLHIDRGVGWWEYPADPVWSRTVRKKSMLLSWLLYLPNLHVGK